MASESSLSSAPSLARLSASWLPSFIFKLPALFSSISFVLRFWSKSLIIFVLSWMSCRECSISPVRTITSSSSSWIFLFRACSVSRKSCISSCIKLTWSSNLVIHSVFLTISLRVASLSSCENSLWSVRILGVSVLPSCCSCILLASFCNTLICPLSWSASELFDWRHLFSSSLSSWEDLSWSLSTLISFIFTLSSFSIVSLPILFNESVFSLNNLKFSVSASNFIRIFLISSLKALISFWRVSMVASFPSKFPRRLQASRLALDNSFSLPWSSDSRSLTFDSMGDFSDWIWRSFAFDSSSSHLLVVSSL